jgi:hypothetical protein
MDPNKKNPKKPNIYVCHPCDFSSRNRKDFMRHVSTDKHIILTDPNCKTPKNPKNSTFDCLCGKSYKHASSLCSHKKTCGNIEKHESIQSDNEFVDDGRHLEVMEIMKYLMKENLEMKSMMMKVIENGTHNVTTHNITTHTNSHNKSFNLQFFLNETCKDAMNIMDFVESIKLQLSDLEKVGELGYVEGISNIIVKNLNELEVTQRPVHCTDKKRETMYIKDEDKWEKDEENSKMKRAIKKVASKNQRLITKFKEEHPDCIKYHSKYSDQYNKIIVESMGGSGDNDTEKEEKIIRNISKNVVVDK